MKILIRIEEESDYRRVEEITKAAFSYPGRIEQGGIGCPYEHWMVHELRKRDGILSLSLVAEVDGAVVGHIICSDAVVKLGEQEIPVLNFGPLSVQPDYQRLGVGKALMHGMIDRAKDLGYGAILFFGRPEYYPQFGFVEAGKFGITDVNGSNYPAFMAVELRKGHLPPDRGGRNSHQTYWVDSAARDARATFTMSPTPSSTMEGRYA